MDGLRCGSAVTEHYRFKARVTARRVAQGTLQIDRGGDHRWRMRDDPRQRLSAGRRRPGRVGRDALGLKCQKYPHDAISERQQQSPIAEWAVVVGMGADIALIHADFVHAVQAIGVPELGVDRLVQVPVEFDTECVQFTFRGLALLEIQGEQIL